MSNLRWVVKLFDQHYKEKHLFKCEGCNVSGIPLSEITYMTPPSFHICKNYNVNGPTPCWFPNCINSTGEKE